ncbi:MAG: hypothetical protein AB7N76_37210 [Planctomycetota bacterium]
MAGAIKFACPHCDRVCKVPAELAGKQGRCPGCRKGLEVPLRSADHLVSGRQTPISGGVIFDDLGRPSGVGRISGSGSELPRAPAELSRATPSGDELPRAPRPSRRARPPSETAQLEDSESETRALTCPGCRLDVPAGAAECPYCHLQLRKEAKGGLHWAIPVAFLLLPMPLFGLWFAQLGLKGARERQNFENAAWVAVWINGVNLLIGLLYMLNRLAR